MLGRIICALLGMIAGALLTALFGTVAGIVKVRRAMIQDMQNEQRTKV